MSAKQKPGSFDFEELFGVNAGYVEQIWTEYLARPDAVPEEWRRFFAERLPQPEGEPAPASAGTATGGEPGEPVEPVKHVEALRGVAARIAENMAESLRVPTATSTREVPVKVLEENRRIVNEHLGAEHRGKISFTHVIAWALVSAWQRVPGMRVRFLERDGKPHRETLARLDLGIAVDVPREDGARSLVVPNVKDCAALSFATFVAAYDAQVRKARRGRLTPADFHDTTCTLTNPGTLGTVSSLPRLMTGQSFIVATGAIDVPAVFAGASPETLVELGIGKVLTLTSTYDHRVIQGADSGEFLRWMHELLIGEHGFYDALFHDLGVPYAPLRMETDRRAAPGSRQRGFEDMERAARVMQYARAYRVRGYLLADLDPLGQGVRTFPELEMGQYGLTIWDLDREFWYGGTGSGEARTLRAIRDVLRATYTRHVGVEYMHIADPEQREWLRTRMEGTRNQGELPRATMLRVLDKLVEAEVFERFLHSRFVGHKRFSLEGGETLIPVLDALFDRAAELGVSHAMLGMAHRGRLNVLAHVMGKPLTRIFTEFEGQIDPQSTQGSGDVKYHLGARARYRTLGGHEVELELACNPSHLEAVDPVVEGMARALQDQLAGEGGGDAARRAVLPVLIHGDAAFAGQGVVGETLQMSQLHGYRTGGTVHVIVNNQIGYTTDPRDSRSTLFCTDVAKAIQAPIFHVNGDDPLAAVRMIRLAVEYRQAWQRECVLDIVCYRRHGHNEGDEPSFTQPLLYKRIEAHASVRAIYQDWLLRAGVLDASEAARFDESLQQRLREALGEVRQSRPPESEAAALRDADDAAAAEPPRAAVPAAPPDEHALLALLERVTSLPEGFVAHEKLAMLLERRRAMGRGEQPFDFATAETLAFAVLLDAGRSVRLAGQDSGRGTFSQRHAVFVDTARGSKHVPLAALAVPPARFLVVDSLLSEEAALGFEYGYSVREPGGLTLWEAQFGDFGNGAQIQIDQFLAAGEAKWGQRTNLVLLLPHGYDGQGPEHSSARLERFLQLVAEDNLRVANASNAGQYFHLLREQGLDPDRKPLVVMTQKSLLRQRTAGSPLAALCGGRFEPLLVDRRADDPVPDAEVERVVACSGKVFYELLEAAQAADCRGLALLRVERLAPWPAAELAAALARFPARRELVWCQEEPANMGAWTYVRDRAAWSRYAGRKAAASPATGVLQVHKHEQARLVADALGLDSGGGSRSADR